MMTGSLLGNCLRTTNWLECPQNGGCGVGCRTKAGFPGVRCGSHRKEPAVSSEPRGGPTGGWWSGEVSWGPPAGETLRKPQKPSQEKEAAMAQPHSRPRQPIMMQPPSVRAVPFPPVPLAWARFPFLHLLHRNDRADGPNRVTLNI